MFEPQRESIACPKCRTHRVYFDRQMGHYCMFCGYQFSDEDVHRFLKHEFRQIHTVLGTDRTN